MCKLTSMDRAVYFLDRQCFELRNVQEGRAIHASEEAEDRQLQVFGGTTGRA
jgi:hypothetical protein